MAAVMLLFCAVALARMTPSGQAQSAGAPKDEALAIIVNSANPVENLSLDELRKFCLAERKHWPDGRKVTVVLREPGQAEREAVLRQVYRMSESEFARHFLQGAFTGDLQNAPKQLATANGVRRFVFNVPGALGFVRVSDLDPSVKAIRLDGLLPTDPQHKLKLEGH